MKILVENRVFLRWGGGGLNKPVVLPMENRKRPWYFSTVPKR